MPRKPTNKSLLKQSQTHAARLRAQIEVLTLVEAKKRLQAALSIHNAADRGRRNSDWRASNASADLANIPDGPTLTARARQLERDSWIVRSTRKAFVRNVVGGHGIIVTPHAKDPDGKPLAKLNRVAQLEWSRWASNKASVDVERKKTFPQMQRLAASEQLVVGEHLWMWSYTPPKDKKLEPCGLHLQAFEPEQFDLTIVSNGDNEVRGGVEVDLNGAPVAYHIYTRNPSDLLYRYGFKSERVDASRMFHYFSKERVLQARGVTRLTSVMSDVRDLERYRGAVLWRAIMESCIGLIVTQPLANTTGPSSFFPAQPNVGTATQSGMQTDDFVPGMVAHTLPGEEVEPFATNTPSSNYGPFHDHTVRGVGAGVGMSYGQVMRQSEGSYSSARQDMLEDRKEWEAEHDLIKADLIRPTYQMWFQFAADEGRFDGVEGFDYDEYMNDRERFLEAEYIPPPQTWIDPEKEANAFAVLIKNRLITREEIIAMRGERIWNVASKIAAEYNEFDDLKLSLPENTEERQALREMLQSMLADKSGGMGNVTANATNIDELLEKAGVPTRDDYKPPLLPVAGPQSTPITGEEQTDADGNTIAGKAEKPPKPAPVNGNGKPFGTKNGGSASISRVRVQKAATNAPPARLRGLIAPIADVPDTVPNYKDARSPASCCDTCSFNSGGVCSKYNFVFDEDKVCDSWTAKTLVANINGPQRKKTLAPQAPDGQPELDKRFFADADAGHVPGTSGS